MDVLEQAEEKSKDVYGPAKPTLRGLVHAWSIAPFAAAGVILTIVAQGATESVAVAVYTVAITSMLAASAAYHRLKVSAGLRVWLRRIDHSMIGVAVAGTYTPVVVLVSSGSTRAALLTLLWLGAFGGLGLTLAWPEAPRWLRAGLYITLGWAGFVILPELLNSAGIGALLLVALGGVFYSAGALVYARRSPDPSPTTFGFHEIFHTFVVAAAACHFAAIAVVVSRID